MIELKINGKPTRLEVSEDTPLLWAIRDVANLTGTKYGCGMSLCGACTVYVNGELTRSCVTTVGSVSGQSITTIEGLDSPVSTAVQEAWTKLSVPQCGYCQSGQVMAASALLAKNKKPSDADIDAAMSGHICRCGTYPKIREAIKDAASKIG